MVNAEGVEQGSRCGNEKVESVSNIGAEWMGTGAQLSVD